jgi:hypothetical protein
MTGFEETVHAAEVMQAIHHCLKHLLPNNPEIYAALLQVQKIHQVCTIHTSRQYTPKDSFVVSVLDYPIYSYIYPQSIPLNIPCFNPNKYQRPALICRSQPHHTPKKEQHRQRKSDNTLSLFLLNSFLFVLSNKTKDYILRIKEFTRKSKKIKANLTDQ